MVLPKLELILLMTHRAKVRSNTKDLIKIFLKLSVIIIIRRTITLKITLSPKT